MELGQDDFWVHSPQFKKVVGLTIGELFGTKITMFSPQNTVAGIYSIVFVDAHFNRWGVSLLKSDAAESPDKNRLCMRFPFSGTKVQPFMSLTEQEISHPVFNTSLIHLYVQDTGIWYGETKAASFLAAE
jgi:hypothetical protein